MNSDIEQNNTLPSCPLCTGGRTSWFLWIGIFIFIVIFIYANRSASTTMSFAGVKSIERELAEAKAANRPIFINFYATWCGACRMMDREVFTKEPVAQALSTWVSASFDVDADPQTADAFGIQSLPTLVILSPQGRQIARREGVMSVQEFLQFLQSAENELPTTSTQPST